MQRKLELNTTTIMAGTMKTFLINAKLGLSIVIFGYCCVSLSRYVAPCQFPSFKLILSPVTSTNVASRAETAHFDRPVYWQGPGQTMGLYVNTKIYSQRAFLKFLEVF